MDILTDIQVNLKAPKSQYNDFGKYKYRNCEDILEALKPLLTKHNVSLTISDEIVLIGARYYIKATTFLRQDNTVLGSTSAYAREAETRKGMDDSQITGSASSYARKYALNGLFAIDDTKDADSNGKPEPEKKKETPKPPPTPSNKGNPVLPSEPQRKKFFAMAKAKGLNTDEVTDFRNWLKLHPNIDTLETEKGVSITKNGMSLIFDEFDALYKLFSDEVLAPRT